MPVLVLTDSSARLPGAGLEGAIVLDITVALASIEQPDHLVDVALGNEALRRGEPVKSRPPTVLDYLTAIDAGGADGAIVLTPAEEFTPMREIANQAACLSVHPTVVIDTRTTAAAQALVVQQALAVARMGAGLDEVHAVARDASRRAELVAALGPTPPLATSGLLPSGQPGRAARRRVRLSRLKAGPSSRLVNATRPRPPRLSGRYGKSSAGRARPNHWCSMRRHLSWRPG